MKNEFLTEEKIGELVKGMLMKFAIVNIDGEEYRIDSIIEAKEELILMIKTI